MRVTPADQRQYYWLAISTELFGVLIIAYCFLTPLAWSTKIMITPAISLFLVAAGRIESYVELEKKRVAESQWFDNLAIRFALDMLLDQSRKGEPLHIDWQVATTKALEDIKVFDEDIKTKEMLAESKVTETVVWLVFCPIQFAARGLTGFGIAWLIRKFASEIIPFIT